MVKDVWVMIMNKNKKDQDHKNENEILLEMRKCEKVVLRMHENWQWRKKIMQKME